jgi:capsular polysaccharide biosynthesis protein
MPSAKNEVQLMDYLNVIWKRKWFIIIPTIFIALAAGIMCLVMPRLWEIDCVIQPSKFFIQTEQGQFEEVLVVNPKQIVGEINQESYNSLIAAELNISPRDFPRLRAENLRDTSLVRLALREEDAKRGKLILNSLFNHLKKELDKRINFEIRSLDTQIAAKQNFIGDTEGEIKTKENEILKKNNEMKIKDLNAQLKEIEKNKAKKEIEGCQNKLKISEERVKSIMEEMKSVKARIDEIDEQLRKAIAEKKEGTEALSMLLYSNEVQQNLRYYNTLDEKSTIERLTQENLRLEIHDKGEKIEQLDTQIKQDYAEKNIIAAEIGTIKNEIGKLKNRISTLKDEMKLLEDKKMRIDYAQLVKEPTSSLYPVSPNTKVIMILSAVLSLTLFVILAFFLEYIEPGRAKKITKA